MCLAVSVFPEFRKHKKCVWLFQCLQSSENVISAFGCFSVCRVQETEEVCLAVSVFAEFRKHKKCVWLFQCLQSS